MVVIRYLSRGYYSLVITDVYDEERSFMKDEIVSVHGDKLVLSEDRHDMEDELRKSLPVFSGVAAYFPEALLEVSKCSAAGNEQHHPDKPLHWDKGKSNQHLDSMLRHLLDSSHTDRDTDGQLHLAKVAWRALAALQIKLESLE